MLTAMANLVERDIRVKISPRGSAETSFSYIHNHLSTTCLDDFLTTADLALCLVQLLAPSK